MEEARGQRGGLTDGIDYTRLIPLALVGLSAIRYAAVRTCYPCWWVDEVDVGVFVIRKLFFERASSQSDGKEQPSVRSFLFYKHGQLNHDAIRILVL